MCSFRYFLTTSAHRDAYTNLPLQASRLRCGAEGENSSVCKPCGMWTVDDVKGSVLGNDKDAYNVAGIRPNEDIKKMYEIKGWRLVCLAEVVRASCVFLEQ